MTTKHIVSSAAAVSAACAVLLGGSAAAATRDAAALHRCGAVASGGAAWQVTASSAVSCANARSLVKKLGAMRTPPKTHPYYPGTYLGMRCLGAKTNGKRLIDCGGSGGRAVAAAAKS